MSACFSMLWAPKECGCFGTSPTCAHTLEILLHAYAWAADTRLANESSGQVTGKTTWSRRICNAEGAVLTNTSAHPLLTGGSDEQDQEDQEGWMEDLEAARALSSVPSGGKWPVLTEMEGGKDVQLMQGFIIFAQRDGAGHHSAAN
eukprot:1134502-Pelagomonas_calceolata.AAC.8